jgi:hypothetical protein
VRLAGFHAVCGDIPLGGLKVELGPLGFAQLAGSNEREGRQLQGAAARQMLRYPSLTRSRALMALGSVIARAPAPHAHRRRGRARRGRGPWHNGTPTRSSQGTMRGLDCAARLDTAKAGGQFGRRYVAHGPAAKPGKDVRLQPPDLAGMPPTPSARRASRATPARRPRSHRTAAFGALRPAPGSMLPARRLRPSSRRSRASLSPTVAATVEELDALLAPGLKLRIRCR